LSKSKKNGSQYVTHSQCSETMSPIISDLKTIKNALVGENLLGGLVNQVSTMATKLDQVITEVDNAKNEKKEKKKISSAWKIAALSAFSALLGILLGHLLDVFW
jgi:hypothetical protein